MGSDAANPGRPQAQQMRTPRRSATEKRKFLFSKTECERTSTYLTHDDIVVTVLFLREYLGDVSNRRRYVSRHGTPLQS